MAKKKKPFKFTPLKGGAFPKAPPARLKRMTRVLESNLATSKAEGKRKLNTQGQLGSISARIGRLNEQTSILKTLKGIQRTQINRLGKKVEKRVNRKRKK